MKKQPLFSRIFLLFFTIFLSAFLFPSLSPARESDPILVIDPGGHKAIIRNVIFTKDGKYLLSASDDKTVRVWEVKSGKISRVIRGQIGAGSEGKIYSAALSPDNEWLAVGGWMLAENNQGQVERIRLYHFPTGKLVGLLKGHTNVVTALAFSPDSNYLASSGGLNDFSIRIWEIKKRKEIHKLMGHESYIYALVWLSDGKRLVSGSDDKTLMIWNGVQGKFIKKMTGHTDIIRSLALSPDGKTLASGAYDKTIRLWDGETGDFIKVLVKSRESTVDSLAFSPDGKKILAGAGSGTRLICNVYSVPSGKERIAFTEHTNIVTAVAVSPKGPLAATGGGDDKEIFLWDMNTGKIKKKIVGKGKSVWAVGYGYDGSSLAWGNELDILGINYKGPLQYRMKIGPTDSGKDLNQYRVEYTGAVEDTTKFIRAVESWKGYQLKAKIGGDFGLYAILQVIKNGKLIAEIQRDPTTGYDHRSYTLTVDTQFIISGGGAGVLALYKTETGEKVRDFIGHTGDVWSVAVSLDGTRVVSGSADQTVRLWNMETGENLVTIFFGTDKDWVAWTKSGYFTSSPHGDQYVGWQINKGEAKNPEFYHASQFAEILYRPEITAGTLSYSSEDTAVSNLGAAGAFATVDMNEFAPPELDILSVKKKSASSLRVHKKAKRASQQIINITVKTGKKKAKVRDAAVYVNGRQVLSPVQRRKAARKTGKTQTFSVSVPSSQQSIVKVEFTNNKKARAWMVTEVAPTKSQGKIGPQGDLTLFAIGVNTLENIEGMDLDFPAGDAADMVKIMKKTKGKLYNDIKIFLFSDTAGDLPLSGKITEALNTLKKAKSNDTVMIFLAGNAVTTTKNEFLFLTRDASKNAAGGYNTDSVLAWATVKAALAKTGARKIILLDTGYSGAADMTDVVKKGSGDNITVFASSRGSQAAQGGYFTSAIAKALSKDLPADSSKNGSVEITELARYVKKEVEKLADNQTPTLALPVGLKDFVFYGK